MNAASPGSSHARRTRLALVVVALTAGCPVGLPGLIVEFSASSTLVGPNEPFTLTWQTLNTRSCSVVGDSAPADHASNGSGTVKLANVGVHKYTLQCIGLDGTQIDSAPLAVSVNAADVHVKNDTDVKNLTGATEIKGSLVFDPGCSITDVTPLAKLEKIGGDLDYQCAGIADLTLPALAHVGGSVVIHGGDPTMTELHLDALVDIGADLSLKDLPKLKTASANALQSVGQDLVVSAYDYPSYPSIFPNEASDDCTSDQKPRTLPFLDELDLPQLATVGRELTSEDANALSALSLPALTSIGAALIITGLGANTASASIDFPKLTAAGTILLIDNQTLSSVTMPALTTTTSDPAVDNYAQFPTPDPRDPLFHVYQQFVTDISCGPVGVFPAPETGDVYLQSNGPGGADNSSITTLDVSGLTTVGGTLWLTGLPESTIALPALASTRGLLFQDDNALTTISLPSLTALGSNDTQIDTLPALTSIDAPALGPSPKGTLILNPKSTALTSINLGSLTEVDQLEIDDVGGADLSQLGVVQVDTKLTIGAQFAGTSLRGLESVAIVKGELDLSGAALTSFAGLDNLTEVDGLLLFDDGLTLTTVDGFPALASIGSVRVFGDTLTHVTLPALTTVTDADQDSPAVDFENNDNLVSVSLPALTTVQGGVALTGFSIDAVSAPALDNIHGDLFFSDTALTNVDGFCALTHVVNLQLVNNTKIADLGGFARVHVDANLEVTSSPFPGDPPQIVPQCQIEQLFDQSGAATGTFDFTESPANARCALPSTCGAGGGEGEGEGAAAGEGEGEGAAGEGEGEGAAGEGEGEGAAGEGEGEGAAGEGEGEGEGGQ